MSPVVLLLLLCAITGIAECCGSRSRGVLVPVGPLGFPKAPKTWLPEPGFDSFDTKEFREYVRREKEEERKLGKRERRTAEDVPEELFARSSANSTICRLVRSYIRLPMCPLRMEMKLYTRTEGGNGKAISATNIPSQFRSSKPVVLVVPGWSTEMNTDFWWQRDLTNAHLNNVDYNVIVVKWDSFHPNKKLAARDTKEVGAKIAGLVKTLVERGLTQREQSWCIGHGLGAHVCGQAGRRYHLGRITALDPAGWVKLMELQRDVLQKSDAVFVDAIHTGTELFGLARPVGHVDFYPNGGRTQPGCRDVDDMTCSHNRAVHYFIESLMTCRFYATKRCTSFNITKGPDDCSKCSKCQEMGFPANTLPGRGVFVLETNASPPYCLPAA